MLFEALKGGLIIDSNEYFSVGGGKVVDPKNPLPEKHIYPLTTIEEIIKWCDKDGYSFWEYVEMCEGPEIWDYLSEIWEAMKQSIDNGLNNEGVLPGGLGVRRKAATYFTKAKGYNRTLNSRGNLYAYALAVSVENASAELRRVMKGGDGHEKMMADYAELAAVVGGAGASDRFACRMVELLKSER